jgi:tetratricopeptide (TPR) repeat protein
MIAIVARPVASYFSMRTKAAQGEQWGGCASRDQSQRRRSALLFTKCWSRSPGRERQSGDSLWPDRTEQAGRAPLAQATTPSLEARQALSLAGKALDNGDYPASVLSFQRAIALDPNFAAAYSGLSTSYIDLGERSLAVANAKKAYELRQRASEPEKLGIESSYDWLVTGDLEKVRQVYELFVQTYPRDANARFNLGNVYDNLGQYEQGLEQARESLRLEPTSPLNHGYLVYSYLVLNRLSEAQVAAKEALARFPDLRPLHEGLYVLAFLENDSTGMAQQLAWAARNKGIDDAPLGLEGATSAYFGRLAQAREQSRRAVASAEEAKERETAASHDANSALREALFGNRREARLLSAAALQRSGGRDVQYAAALAFAMAADSAKSQSLADDLATLFPEDTIVRRNYLPTLRAQRAQPQGWGQGYRHVKGRFSLRIDDAG